MQIRNQLIISWLKNNSPNLPLF